MPATYLYAMRVSKKVWYLNGGFSNPRCFRKQIKNGGWMYFMRHD